MTNSLLVAWKYISRSRLRSSLLVLTTFTGFLIFGVLGSLNFSLLGGGDTFSQNRLMIVSQSGLVDPLPISYQQRIEKLSGVKSVGHATWFGLYYQESNQDILSFAVDAEKWLEQHPETQVSEQSVRAFMKAKNGLLVNANIADRFNWRVGDLISLKSVLFQPSNGDEFWSFEISGLFTTSKVSGGRKYIIAHYDYLNDSRRIWKNTVGAYIVVPEPGLEANKLATDIDDFFLNSSHETLSNTDKAFHDDFFKRIGNVFLLIKMVLIVSFASMILVVASTMALSVRQRTRDIGILKVIGYSNSHVFAIIFCEIIFIVAIGCLLGLAVAYLVNDALIYYWPMMPEMNLPIEVVLQAIGAALVLSLFSGLIPGIAALKMKPINALKTNG
ncbi:MAG: putative ABC transport system permease protein [Arenicella sp.]|jgi:putative ABC transport system permease protein